MGCHRRQGRSQRGSGDRRHRAGHGPGLQLRHARRRLPHLRRRGRLRLRGGQRAAGGRGAGVDAGGRLRGGRLRRPRRRRRGRRGVRHRGLGGHRGRPRGPGRRVDQGPVGPQRRLRRQPGGPGVARRARLRRPDAAHRRGGEHQPGRPRPDRRAVGRHVVHPGRRVAGSHRRPGVRRLRPLDRGSHQPGLQHGRDLRTALRHCRHRQLLRQRHRRHRHAGRLGARAVRTGQRLHLPGVLVHRPRVGRRGRADLRRHRPAAGRSLASERRRNQRSGQRGRPGLRRVQRGGLGRSHRGVRHRARVPDAHQGRSEPGGSGAPLVRPGRYPRWWRRRHRPPRRRWR